MYYATTRNAPTCRAAISGVERPRAVRHRGVRWLVIGLLAMSVPGLAQQSPAPATPPRDVPRPDQLEPGVNTSATPAPAKDVSPGSSTAPVSSSSSGAGNTAGASGNTSSPASKAAAKPSSRGKPAAQSNGDAQASNARPPADSKAPKSGAGAGKAQDRLQLDATQITGNQELPKVLYIVPWKRADLGDLLGKPANSLLDDVLEPVDRDVFKRENRYYDALQPDGAAPADAATGAPGQGSSGKH